MNPKKKRGTLEDDLEDQYFDDDEDTHENRQNTDKEEEEVDPLDAFMQDINEVVKQDQKAQHDNTQEVSKKEVFVSDDPLDSFMDSMKEKLIKEHNRKHNIKKKEGDPENEDDPDFDDTQYEFLDSEGNLDFDAVKKMKKQKIEPLVAVDHATVTYEPFNKDFYDEHEELKALPDDRVKQLRKDMDIRVHGGDVPKPIVSFGHLPFDQQMKSLIIRQEFEKPTPIQCQSLPCILSGRDVIGVAKTGSGKTLAYVWPMIIHVLDQREVEKNEGPIGLIMCPTRELAQQVYIETKRFAKVYNCKVAALLGGENKHEQWKELKSGVDIIIATPGRLIEMTKKKATNLRRCTYVVMDEADRMFSMGFEYQVRSIIGQIRPDRQTLLFSATFKDRIQKLCFDILHEPIRINIGKDNQANEDVKQEVVVVSKPEEKINWILGNIPYFYQLGKILVFANQINSCEELAKTIAETLSLNVLVLHGDKLQQERTMIINNFKTKPEQNILVATDVASRGLDIPEIRTVVNFECPKDGDTYIHRIGRTGRAGNKEGTAYTLIQRLEVRFALTLTKFLEIAGQPVPKDLEDIAMNDEEYLRNRKMKKLGLKKGNAASKLLEKALAGGKRGTAGLGYSEDKPNKKSYDTTEKESDSSFQKASYAPTVADLTNPYANNNLQGEFQVQNSFQQQAPIRVSELIHNQPMQDIYQNSVVFQSPQANMVYQNPQVNTVYQTPQVNTVYQNPKVNNVYQSVQTYQPYQSGGQQKSTTLSAREEIRAEYSNRIKGNMQSSFRNSFVSSGNIEPSKGLPTITFKAKSSMHDDNDEPQKTSNITIQLPKKKNVPNDQPVVSNLQVPQKKGRFSETTFPADIPPVAAKKFKSNWDRPPEDM